VDGNKAIFRGIKIVVMKFDKQQKNVKNKPVCDFLLFRIPELRVLEKQALHTFKKEAEPTQA
jgi:hypothetical protein